MGRGGDQILDQPLRATLRSLADEQPLSPEIANIRQVIHELTGARDALQNESFPGLDSDQVEKLRARALASYESDLVELQRELHKLESQLYVQKPELIEALEDPVAVAEAQAYRAQGAKIAEALFRSKTMTAFARQLEHLESINSRDQSKKIEQAFVASLPKFLMVDTENGRRRGNIISENVVSGDAGANEGGESPESFDDRFWVDVVIELDGQRYFFEFKAVAESKNSHDLGGKQILSYILGGPMKESGIEPEIPKPEELRELIADGLTLRSDPQGEPREPFLITFSKNCLDGRELNGAEVRRHLSCHPLTQINAESLVDNKINGLQVKFSSMEEISKPRGPLAARFLFARLQKSVYFKRSEDDRGVNELLKEKSSSPVIVSGQISSHEIAGENISQAGRLYGSQGSKPGLGGSGKRVR
jgi:hypothetical protein